LKRGLAKDLFFYALLHPAMLPLNKYQYR